MKYYFKILLIILFNINGNCVLANSDNYLIYWNINSPLMAEDFDLKMPCNRSTSYLPQFVESEKIGQAFISQSTAGVVDILSGLCFNALGANDNALNAFRQSKIKFEFALDHYTKMMAHKTKMEQIELKKREQMVSATGQVLGALLSGSSKSTTSAVLKNVAREYIKSATENEIQTLRQEYKKALFVPPNEFTKTVRIPVIPVAGFLKLVTKIQSPNGSHCTGSFVGPKHVLTNLHCVNPGMKVIRDHVVVREEYSVKTWWTYRGERGVLSQDESRGGTTRGYGDEDWALIEINEDRPDPDDYLVVPAKTPSVPNVMIAGYSADVSEGKHVSLDLNCPVEKVTSNFQYQCSTYKGASGSPIISMYDQRLIVALNNASSTGQTDTANSRATKFGVRVEKFAPKLYELLGKRPPEWTESNVDARTLLVHAKTMFEQRGKAPNLPKWE